MHVAHVAQAVNGKRIRQSGKRSGFGFIHQKGLVKVEPKVEPSGKDRILHPFVVLSFNVSCVHVIFNMN